jgi:hypothetical protein
MSETTRARIEVAEPTQHRHECVWSRDISPSRVRAVNDLEGEATLGYRLMGRMHALALTLRDGERGQGTVEYVGLILLISAVLLAVVKFGHGFKGDALATTIINKLKSAIDGADPGSKSG